MAVAGALFIAISEKAQNSTRAAFQIKEEF